MRCTDHKSLIKILESNGFELVRKKKHAIYSNGKTSVAIPGNKNGFSRMLAERLLKDAGIK